MSAPSPGAPPPASPAGAPRGFGLGELGRREAQRQVARTLIRSVVGTTVLISAYYAAPTSADSTPEVVVRVVLMSLGVVAVLVWQLVALANSALPRLRAIEALALTVTVMVVAFATTYLILSKLDPQAFSEELDHTGALYFTVTTLATVGYGDIHARTNGARVAVMIQMVFNVAVIGASARLILAAARRRAESGRSQPA